MKGMRNILIHEYFGLDNEVLWKTIQEDLPSLKEKNTTSSYKSIKNPLQPQRLCGET